MKTVSFAHDARIAATAPPEGAPAEHPLARLTGDARTVLDLGCLDPDLARSLRERGSQVAGLALRPPADASLYERVEAVDADRPESALAEADGPFQAVVSAGALERVRNPERWLEVVRERLAPDGRLVASVFNVAHRSVREALARGEFPCADDGPLARVRFFTETSLVALLEQAGFALVSLERTLDPEPDAADDPDAATLAFRVCACPVPTEGMALVQQRMRRVALEAETARERLSEAERELAALRETVREQAEEIDGLVREAGTFAQRERELRTRLLEAHDQLMRRDEEIYAQQRHEAVLVARAHGAQELQKQVHELDAEVQTRRRQVEERDWLIREQELRLLGLRRFAPGFLRRITVSWFRRGT